MLPGHVQGILQGLPSRQRFLKRNISAITPENGRWVPGSPCDSKEVPVFRRGFQRIPVATMTGIAQL